MEELYPVFYSSIQCVDIFKQLTFFANSEKVENKLENAE